MKKTTFLCFVIASLIVTVNVANAGIGGDKKQTKVKHVSSAEYTKQIKALIGTPDLSLESSFKVDVNFDVSEDNIISVNEIITDNVALEKYIFEKINGMKINGNDIEMKNKTLSFVFKRMALKSWKIDYDFSYVADVLTKIK
ncbi:MAG TPA: hypothetical protein VK766_02100 [Cytophagaceae bacterium]|jgi:hypothetical protein|nr:hypothetical protein [Cytophagaceae bacterium]